MRHFGELLFARQHACRMSDFPTGLDHFVHATGGLLGNVEEIARSRTLLLAYWPFGSEPWKAQFTKTANQPQKPSSVFRLGAASSALTHPLRSCAACNAEMVNEFGASTWLLRFQLPAVWWCQKHACVLEQTVRQRSVWLQPSEGAVPLGAPMNSAEQDALETARSIALALTTLRSVDIWSLSEACLQRLRELGVVASYSRISTGRLSSWLEAQPILRWIRRQGEQVAFPNGNWAVTLLRERRSMHPLKWLVLWTALWQADGAQRASFDFLSAADRGLADPSDQFCLFPSAPGQMASQHWPVNVGRVFADSKTLVAAAAAMNISIRATRLWLTDYPAEARQWMAGVVSSRRQSAIDALESAMREMPGMSRSLLLSRCHTDASWLQANDPLALRGLLDRIPPKAGPQLSLL